MFTDSIQKTVATPKVDPGIAIDRGTARDFSPATCPAAAQRINYDIYGRPVGIPWQGILLNNAACSGCVYPVSTLIAHEDALRPYVSIGPYPIAAPGANYDTMSGASVARAVMPRNVYGTGNRGNFNQNFHTSRGNVAVERMPQDTALHHTMHIGVASHDQGNIHSHL